MNDSDLIKIFCNFALWGNVVMFFWNIIMAELNMYWNKDGWYLISRISTYISLSAIIFMLYTR